MARDPIMNRLRRKRTRAQNNRRRFQKKANLAKRLSANLQGKILAVRARRKPENLWKTVALDGTPIFLGLKLVLLDCRANGWVGILNSADRRKGVAERFGKMSQAKLYECSKVCSPDCHGNCNPANPPDRGSHLLIGDGTVGLLFAQLEEWQLGLDTSYADELRATLSDLGYHAYRPYADSREQHHTNLTKNPRQRLIERGRL